jgi:uncharacterized protein YjiS (DUF1127 family)
MSVIEFRPGAAFVSRAALSRADAGSGFAATLLRAAQLWRRRARDRAELARMGYLALQDLGVPDPSLAWQEASNPFWRDAQAAWREAAAARNAQCRG